jgi:hypothetical protein
MPLEPKFRRTSGRDRLFVDREDVMAVFAEQWLRVGNGPVVFNPVGVGGVGKSRILRQLREHACQGKRTAVLDLQIPAMRQQEDALAVLRIELSRHGVRFDRFDIGYAVLWQRLHPHLQINQADLPFIEESQILSDIIDAASGLSVFGTALSLMQLLNKAATGVKRKRRIHGDETLSQLDELSNQDLVEAVTFLFAEDLRESSSEQHYSIFVDAYEALSPSPLRTARSAMADIWLRDLIAQLDRGVTVVASREPLRWVLDNPDWRPAIRTVHIGALPMDARVELLASCGVTEAREQIEIASASAGLPFYLNLAIDTRAQSLGIRMERVVSHEDILRRFLQHVGDREARVLELLASCRIFDFEIFQTVARRFSLPDDRLTWEALSAYSFVYPAGEHHLRLHQLMRDSLQARLAPSVRVDLASMLHELWRGRARSHSAASQDAAAALSYREQVYHGLQAGQIASVEILAAADAAFRFGGRAASDGILGDLQRHLNGRSDPSTDELEQTAACLEAEAAVRLSDAQRVLAMRREPVSNLSGVAGARLATAAADARRIIGETAAAQRLYRAVWQGHATKARNAAGIWFADLEMCQGRFPEALALAEEILSDADPEDMPTRGEVHRLRHLTYRFAGDFNASDRELSQAHGYYQRAGSPTGLAKIATNSAELLAWRDPAAARDAAARALEIHETIGDQAEIGKTYTALAIAQLGLGKVAEAHASLHSAVSALDRVHYRSGRARAELIRACAYATTGDTDQAVRSVQWGVAELVAVEVYPTLLMLADHLLTRLEVQDAAVLAAARAARREIHPLRSLDQGLVKVTGRRVSPGSWV